MHFAAAFAVHYRTSFARCRVLGVGECCGTSFSFTLPDRDLFLLSFAVFDYHNII